jgi:hypothetical protein
MRMHLYICACSEFFLANGEFLNVIIFHWGIEFNKSLQGYEKNNKLLQAVVIWVDIYKIQ